MSELIIRRAAERDVTAIAELEKKCFADPWSYESVYYDVVKNKIAFYIVAEITETKTGGKQSSDPVIAGYAGIWNVAGEGHITNVAVDPKRRRMHIADAVMETLIRVTEEDGIRKHTLEVRRSNVPAIRLYEKHGFRIAGERKKYYQDNGEDALIMWRGEEG